LSEEKFITRRDFIRSTAGGALATALGSGLASEAKAEKTAKAVLIRDAKVLNEKGELQAEIIQAMIDQAVKTLLEEGNTTQAWGKLVKPSDIVGIKSNSWWKLPTPPELEEAIKRRVMEVGFRKKYRDRRPRGFTELHFQECHGPDQCSSRQDPPLVGSRNLLEELYYVRSRPLKLS